MCDIWEYQGTLFLLIFMILEDSFYYLDRV
jgi:hypothetical protein